MNFVGIGKENAVDFESVLYPAFKPEKNRITICAYENDGALMNSELQEKEREEFHKYQNTKGKEIAGRILGDDLAV
jgi:hypothetical protein